MLRLLIAYLVTIVFLMPCLGQRRDTRAPDRDIPEYWRAFQSREDKGNLAKAVLKNGLTVLIEEQALHPVASVVTYVRAGYLQEDDEVVGVASLIGRLLVGAVSLRKGRETPPALGSALTVETSYDRTCYLAVTPLENVMRALEVHADLLDEPEFHPSQIAAEASLMAEEMGRHSRAPWPHAKRRLLELTYPTQRLGRWPGSNPEALSGMTREKLLQFHGRYYDPKNIIVAVSGAVRREQILEKVVSLYASLKSSGEISSPAATAQSGRTSLRYQHLRGEHKQPFALLAYRVPGVSHPDYYPLLLLSYVMGRGRASLLHQSLVNSGAAFSAKASLEAFQGGGTFFISLAPQPEMVSRAETEALSQLEALRRKGIDREQLNRAKAFCLRDFYESLEAVEERAYLLARYEVLGSYLDWKSLPKRIQEVGPRQVAKVLSRYFGHSNLSLLEYYPEHSEARTFTAESFLDMIRMLVPEGIRKRKAETKDPPTARQKATFTVPQFKPSYNKHDLLQTSILRGPEVYFQEDHLVPLVHVGFFFPGGRANETETNAGITEVMLRTLLRRTEKMEGSFLWNHLESLGAEINVINEPDFFGLQATVLSPYVSKLLSALIQFTGNPRLEETSFEQERGNVRSLVLQNNENDFLQLLERARRELFQNHPYSRGRYGTEKSLTLLSLTYVQNWVRTQMAGVHPLIIVRGDIQGTSFLQDWIPVLSNSDYRYRKLVIREIIAQQGGAGRSRTLRSPLNSQASQKALIVTFPGPEKGTRDELVLDVIEKALAGSGGRLYSSLRYPQSLVADVGIFHMAGVSGGGIFAYLATSAENEEKALEVLLQEFSRLKSFPLREGEFSEALVATVGSFYMRRQRGRDYVLELTRNLLAGENIRDEKRFLSTVRGITRDDVMAVAKEYFQVEKKPDLQGSSSQLRSQHFRLTAAGVP